MRRYIAIASLAFLILVIPHFFRAHMEAGALMGEESYYHARMAEGIVQGSPEDLLGFGGRQYLFDAYDYAIAALGFLIPVYAASILLPIMLGLASSLLFYYVMGRMGINERERLIAALLFVTSPIFVFLFAISSHLSLVVFLFLLGISLMMRRSILAVLPLALIGLFGPLHAAVAVSAIIMISMRFGRKYAVMNILALVIVAVGYSVTRHAKYLAISGQGTLKDAFSLFGAEIGLSIFLLFLAVAGMVPTWKSRRFYVYPLILLSAFYMFAGPGYLVYVNLIICPLAAYGIISLFDRRWELSLVRDLSMFVIGLGLLFLTTSYMHDLVSGPPDKDLRDAMIWLEANTRPREVILSSQQNGFWIEYYAERPVVWDGLRVGISGMTERSDDVRIIFTSRNLDETVRLLRNYRVRFILIDGTMADQLVNEKKQSGLPFLMRNTDRFELAQQIGDTQIWEFRG